jgi:alpha-tubulin suppressor-like RCC1 family protein
VQVTGLADVEAVTVGNGFTCAVLGNGTAWCWGAGHMGQLGNGGLLRATTPAPVSGLTEVTAITAGGRHACAVRSDGTAWCWGAADDPVNFCCQLGSLDQQSSLIPVPVYGLEQAVVSLAAGDLHTCAALEDGTSWCWGDNYWSQLGIYWTGGPECWPVPVMWP